MNRRFVMKQLACAALSRRRWAPAPRRRRRCSKFSHTDQPGGAREAAALIFAKSGRTDSQGRVKVQAFAGSSPTT